MEKKTVNKNRIILSIFVLFLLIGVCFQFLPNAPMVSVVIPTYNREKLLPRAIDSILKQTYQDFEIIVVDDASTDQTAQLLKEYQKKSDKIKVITHTSNKGVSTARNTGNKYARGKYIAIMDSDDFAYPQFLEKAVSFMEKNSQVTIGVPVKFAYYANKKDDVITDLSTIPTFAWHYPVYRFIAQNSLGNVGNIFKRSFIEKYNISYSNEYTCGEDYDFWVKMILNGATVAKIQTINPLIVFRAYGGLSVYGNCISTNYEVKQKISQKINYELNNDDFELCPALFALEKALPTAFTKKEFEYIHRICPAETDTFLKVEHKGWADYFVFTQDGSHVYRAEVRETAKVLLFVPYEKITVEWDKWGKETFFYNKSKKTYIFKDEPKDQKEK